MRGNVVAGQDASAGGRRAVWRVYLCRPVAFAVTRARVRPSLSKILDEVHMTKGGTAVPGSEGEH